MNTVFACNWSYTDLLNTGTLNAVELRPQHITVMKPHCTTCDTIAEPVRVAGRWDRDRGATAIPFDPVWVRMSCGCDHGDLAASHPPH